MEDNKFVLEVSDLHTTFKKNSGSTTATTATYSFTTEGKHNGMLVRCRVKDASGNSVTSNEVIPPFSGP